MSLVVMLTTILVQPGPSLLEGQWRNPSGSVIVAISHCGEAMCGRVEWASGEAQADARRGGTDPLIGVEVLSSFKPRGEGRWMGRLFVPDLNKRLKAELRQLGPDQVKVIGCAIGGLVCKSEIWTAVDVEERSAEAAIFAAFWSHRNAPLRPIADD